MKTGRKRRVMGKGWIHIGHTISLETRRRMVRAVGESKGEYTSRSDFVEKAILFYLSKTMIERRLVDDEAGED